MKYHYQHLCLRGDSDRQHSHLLGNRDAYMRDHYHQHMPSSMLHSDPGGLAWDMRDESEEDDEVLMEDMLREPLSHFPVRILPTYLPTPNLSLFPTFLRIRGEKKNICRKKESEHFLSSMINWISSHFFMFEID